MEYHAIEDAISFERLKKVLIDKAKNGVEVRIFYDDLGSIFFLNKEFIKRMRDEGIQCRVFNPLKVIVNMFMNNRDHRKITVIDGKVGFTGGYNLADEYFNITHPYGYWKDTGVKLTGDAVKSLTASFLTMWNAIDHTDSQEAYDEYIDATDGTYNAASQECYVQPYSDNPLGHDRIGEDVYLNILKNAKHYVYITTPYLIITDEMERELRLAVKRGVDVRIVTPGIPDKKMVYKITRSYYEPLCSAGVRIYEYTPGFCHAKQWVADDEVCVVGTINMDFRSLYLHFENAVFTYNRELAGKVKADMLDNFEISNEVTSDYAVDVIRPLKLGTCMLHMISPLL
jgi:cardiolipin synthase